LDEVTAQLNELLRLLVEEGLSPGQALVQIKRSIDQAADNAESEAQAAGVEAKSQSNPGKGSDPPGQANKDDKGNAPPESQGASNGKGKSGDENDQSDQSGKPDQDNPDVSNENDNPGKGGK